MAKKSFNISSTLSKNQEPKLAEKIPLKKKTKDVTEVAKKVAMIHQEDSQASEGSAQVDKPAAKKKAAPKVKAKPEKLVRLTIDTPASIHRKLKIRSIEKGLSMRDYILRLLEKELV